MLLCRRDLASPGRGRSTLTLDPPPSAQHPSKVERRLPAGSGLGAQELSRDVGEDMNPERMSGSTASARASGGFGPLA